VFKKKHVLKDWLWGLHKWLCDLAVWWSRSRQRISRNWRILFHWKSPPLGRRYFMSWGALKYQLMKFGSRVHGSRREHQIKFLTQRYRPIATIAIRLCESATKFLRLDRFHSGKSHKICFKKTNSADGITKDRQLIWANARHPLPGDGLWKRQGKKVVSGWQNQT